MSNVWISRDDIFAALQMRQVLEHYGIKSGRGSSFRIHCPFHEDDRPSCSINSSDKVYNCFGCNSQGNVLDFIAEMEGLDPATEFRAVLETSIEILGHNPSQKRGRNSKSNIEEKAEKEERVAAKSTKRNGSKKAIRSRVKVADINADKKASEAVLNDEDPKRSLEPNRVLEGPAFPLKLDPDHFYLKQRGITKSVAECFGIGFETRSSALMAGRICFPIHNSNGELVAYSGRWADNEDFVDGKGREQERYKLPSGFKKQLELYNLHRVLELFPNTSTIVLVEGFWSVLRLSSLTRSTRVKSGIPCVALMGLSLSEQQMELLKSNGFNNIILMLDGDEEGRDATDRLLNQLSMYFFVRDAYLPDGFKPDDVEEGFLMQIAQEHFPSNDVGELDNSNKQALKPISKTSSSSSKPNKKQSPKRNEPKKPPIDYSIGTSWSQLV